MNNIRQTAMAGLQAFSTGRGAPFKEYAESLPNLDKVSDTVLMQLGIVEALKQSRTPENLAWFEAGWIGKNHHDAVTGNKEDSRDLTKSGQTPEQWRERTLLVALQDRDFLISLVSDIVEGKNNLKDKVKGIYSDELKTEFEELKAKEKAEREKYLLLESAGFSCTDGPDGTNSIKCIGAFMSRKQLKETLSKIGYSVMTVTNKKGIAQECVILDDVAETTTVFVVKDIPAA